MGVKEVPGSVRCRLAEVELFWLCHRLVSHFFHGTCDVLCNILGQDIFSGELLRLAMLVRVSAVLGDPAFAHHWLLHLSFDPLCLSCYGTALKLLAFLTEVKVVLGYGHVRLLFLLEHGLNSSLVGEVTCAETVLGALSVFI